MNKAKLIQRHKKTKYDLCIIGGAGHVGLPFGVVAANSGIKTVLLDINKKNLSLIAQGQFPFKENNGDRELAKALKKKKLFISNSPNVVSNSSAILLVTGTPIDEYLNPNIRAFTRIVEYYEPYCRNGQLLILRSTLYPGTAERMQRYFRECGKKVHVAFCPERIVQGEAIQELKQLPQIVAGCTPEAEQMARKFFTKITTKAIISLSPVEAELSKLYANAWRYITFAAANQFYMIANDFGLDFGRILEAMRNDYPRLKDLPKPGFAAGPCLLKDTMQLASFYNNNFSLGHAAMLINEGLPQYMINNLRKNDIGTETNKSLNMSSVMLASTTNPIFDSLQSIKNIRNKTIGILGMAFKPESDDPRDSLSYKLKKLAQTECKKVLCHDVFIKDSTFSTIDCLIKESDIIILATPHNVYKMIDPKQYPNKKFIDIWHFWG